MQAFMITLLICSVTMSALALLYIAVTPLLAKRYSVMSRYYAWLIFVIGLIIPFRPRFRNPIVKVGMPGNTAVPNIQLGNGALITVHAPTPAPDSLSSAAANISWWHIAAAVWLVGVVVFLAYHVIRHYRFLKLTAHWSDDVTDVQTLTLFQNLKTQMGLSQDIGLRICDIIGSPMMTGFAKPCVLLPGAGFAEDELSFILKHELVHYKRKDLWYKCLVLTATAIHWFNPIVRLMAKAIDLQCELSCDAEVVRSAGADMRLYYSETIIGVVRYHSKLKTTFSTSFYGGKKGMKKRIFSIMDMSRKKAGTAVFCGALILTLGTGFTLAANAETQTPEITKDDLIDITPWISIEGFIPSPEIYAPYAAFGITISKDGRELLYKGQPVRQFVDEKADSWAFYLDETGNGNWSAVRDAAGEITGIESMTDQKAQEYYKRFFAEELNGSAPQVQEAAEVQEIAKVQESAEVKDSVPAGSNKYEKYQPFGVTYSAADEILSFHGQRVKFLIDQPAGEGPDTLWTDAAGTVNLAAIRDASGRITNIESISDEKAKEYQSAVDQYNEDALIGLDERVEARINGLYPEN